MCKDIWTQTAYAGDKDNRRNVMGYVFIVGGIDIGWIPKLQQIIALSIREAKNVATTKADKGLIWLQRLSNELDQ